MEGGNGRLGRETFGYQTRVGTYMNTFTLTYTEKTEKKILIVK